MWVWLRRERAERQFNPLLNQPVKSVKSAFLPFAFPAVPRLYLELSTVTGRVRTPAA
jgi:hypothetical protein